MAHNKHGHITRRALLKAGVALPLVGVAAPNVLSQPLSKSPTKVLDFQTNADVAKGEKEGQLVFYCHENEAGTAGIMQGFSKDFPKIKTSYVRAQTGALYSKILAERQAGRFDVDVLQLSDLSPAFDFQKLQDFGFRAAIRAVVHVASALWRRLLEGIRQIAAARFRLAGAVVRSTVEGRRYDHRDRRIPGVYPVQEPRRQG